MLRAFADVGIAFMELLEVQAKRLGTGAKRVAAGIAIVSVVGVLAGGLLLGGTGFLVWSLYLVFLERFTPAAAAALTGLAVWIVIGVGGWIALSMFRRRGSN